MPKEMVKTFKVKMDKEDYKLLTEYGFYFEKNFEQMVKDVATEIRSHTEG